MVIRNTVYILKVMTRHHVIKLTNRICGPIREKEVRIKSFVVKYDFSKTINCNPKISSQAGVFPQSRPVSLRIPQSFCPNSVFWIKDTTVTWNFVQTRYIKVKDSVVILDFFSNLAFSIKDTMAIWNFCQNSEIFIWRDHNHSTILIKIKMNLASLIKKPRQKSKIVLVSLK